ncbi:MAG TPA: sigma-70 family RNA polymerase sigma factor [Planctomycetota bacterium]
MAGEPESEARLQERLAGGDEAALGELFSRYRERLRRMVELRLDRRLLGRVSASDVLQDSYLEALKRLSHYGGEEKMPIHLWLRLITGQRITDLHRQHFGAAMRDIGREVPINRSIMPQATSISLAAQLVAELESPSQAAVKAEALAQLEAALESMEPLDREVLALRHFEELTNDEVAEVLGIKKAAASNRYVRALKRLRDVLGIQ